MVFSKSSLLYPTGGMEKIPKIPVAKKTPNTAKHGLKPPPCPASVTVSGRTYEKPKRPFTPYNLFFKHQRVVLLYDLHVKAAIDAGNDLSPSLLESIPPPPPDADDFFRSKQHLHNRNVPKKARAHRKTHGKIGFTDLVKKVAKKWKSIPAEERAVYEGYAAEDSARYKAEMIVFKDLIASAAEVVGGNDHQAGVGNNVQQQVQQDIAPPQDLSLINLDVDAGQGIKCDDWRAREMDQVLKLSAIGTRAAVPPPPRPTLPPLGFAYHPHQYQQHQYQHQQVAPYPSAAYSGAAPMYNTAPYHPPPSHTPPPHHAHRAPPVQQQQQWNLDHHMQIEQIRRASIMTSNNPAVVSCCSESVQSMMSQATPNYPPIVASSSGASLKSHGRKNVAHRHAAMSDDCSVLSGSVAEPPRRNSIETNGQIQGMPAGNNNGQPGQSQKKQEEEEETLLLPPQDMSLSTNLGVDGPGGLDDDLKRELDHALQLSSTSSAGPSRRASSSTLLPPLGFMPDHTSQCTQQHGSSSSASSISSGARMNLSSATQTAAPAQVPTKSSYPAPAPPPQSSGTMMMDVPGDMWNLEDILLETQKDQPKRPPTSAAVISLCSGSSRFEDSFSTSGNEEASGAVDDDRDLLELLEPIVPLPPTTATWEPNPLTVSTSSSNPFKEESSTRTGQQRTGLHNTAAHSSLGDELMDLLSGL